LIGLSLAPDLFAFMFEAPEQINQADAIFLHDGCEFFRQLGQQARSPRKRRAR
jgi:hypothetical protein